MSQRAALEAAARSAHARADGVRASDEAGGRTSVMVDLAGDMASFNNASPADTLATRLRCRLRRRDRAARRFGVWLSQARLDMGNQLRELIKRNGPAHAPWGR